MNTPTCATCENKKHFGFSRASLQFYCGMGSNPTAMGENEKVLWIPCHWSRILDKMVTDMKTSPKWCPLRERWKKEARRKRYYFEDGTPRYIACWEYKKQVGGEKYTVTFQHAGRSGMTPHHVHGVGMSADPYHPQGIGMHFELHVTECRKSFGSRISFKDLPEQCQRLVRSDYDEIWGLT